jgi:hypothetical protein
MISLLATALFFIALLYAYSWAAKGHRRRCIEAHFRKKIAAIHTERQARIWIPYDKTRQYMAESLVRFEGEYTFQRVKTITHNDIHHYVIDQLPWFTFVQPL